MNNVPFFYYFTCVARNCPFPTTELGTTVDRWAKDGR